MLKDNESEKIEKLKNLALEIKKLTIKTACHSKSHHLGSSLSILDVLTVLYFDVLNINPDNYDQPDSDFFILSKGHAALGWYATLAKGGFFTEDELLDNFNTDKGKLGVHPDRGSMPGVEISSGSLGHGISIGAGIALANKINNKPNRVYVVVSDGECNEGQIWEAALFAAHQKLDNLTVIVDKNQWQAFGRTKEVMNMDPMGDKWRAFGWETQEIDGHDINKIVSALNDLPETGGKPKVIIANTLKGKGISFLEDTLESHYYCLSEEDANKIIIELG
jgi:transketolase